MKYAKFCFLTFLFSILLFHIFSYSIEFLYPVGHTVENDIDKIYVIYQKSLSHIELWLWDPITKVASKGLLSTYTPAGLKLLPNNVGFSFIDNGRIKVKRFNKRSPKSLDIYEPIYNISEIEWIDENIFYLSAKKEGNFGIFQVDSRGIVQSILEKEYVDCMYPQKMGDSLFYIERIIKEGVYKRDFISYKILKTDYTDKLNKKGFLADLHFIENAEDYFQYLMQEDKSEEKIAIKKLKHELLTDFRSCPIAFLKMISNEEGFFLEHPSEVDRQDVFITFDYYHIKKIDGVWNCQRLFDFSIPTFLLLDSRNDRLYESMFPLLPRIYDELIYFVDCSQPNDIKLNLFCYNMKTDNIKQKTSANLGIFLFSPICVKNKVFYGGNMSDDEKLSPIMWMNENGEVFIDFPSISKD